jgi:hypothetical protein
MSDGKMLSHQRDTDRPTQTQNVSGAVLGSAKLAKPSPSAGRAKRERLNFLSLIAFLSRFIASLQRQGLIGTNSHVRGNARTYDTVIQQVP